MRVLTISRVDFTETHVSVTLEDGRIGYGHPYTTSMQRKPFKLLANVLAGWLLAAGIALGQPLGLAYTSAKAQSYGNEPVPELVYARFGKSQDPLIREQVAQGMLNKADALSQAGEAAESAATYDLVYERFGQDPAPNVLCKCSKR
jgi:hypothetical protein